MARGKNAGNRGQGSNWASRTKRRKIHERDGWKCVWTLDHIVPRSEGGSNAPNNLLTACMSCNRLRSNTDWHQFAQVVGRAVWKYGCRTLAPKGARLRKLTAPIRKRIRAILALP